MSKQLVSHDNVLPPEMAGMVQEAEALCKNHEAIQTAITTAKVELQKCDSAVTAAKGQVANALAGRAMQLLTDQDVQTVQAALDQAGRDRDRQQLTLDGLRTRLTAPGVERQLIDLEQRVA